MGDVAGGLPGAPKPISEARRRIRGLVSIAADHDCSLSLEELSLLLPDHLFPSVGALESFVIGDRMLGKELVVAEGELAPRGREGLIPQRPAQRGLNLQRQVEAQVFASNLANWCPWIYVIGISGSMAFGGPRPTDDVDLFMAVRRRRLWITLFVALAMAKLVRRRNGGSPLYCFNRVVDFGQCVETFQTAHDPLLAREALNVKVLVGEEYYRELLAAAPWMGKYFPRLYEFKVNSRPGPGASRVDTGRAVWSLLNLAAFLAVGPYLWAAGLVRNRRLRRAGNHQAEFRTIIEARFCAFESAKYDALREEYRRFFEDGAALH